jgi:hypothetical protein
VPIFLGGLLAWFCERTVKSTGTSAGAPAPGDAERQARKGMLFSAGVITGEALMGIVIAFPIVATGSAVALALPERYRLGERPLGMLIGLAVLAVITYFLYRTATATSSRSSRTS